jgi:4-hydroxy-tetrahydrodipicolinate reductase
MANLIVAGAAGRMGRLLTSLIAQDRAHRLVGAVEASGVPALGTDAGTVAGVAPLGVPITADYAAVAVPGTITLDFTVAKAALEHLEIAVKNGASIVRSRRVRAR